MKRALSLSVAAVLLVMLAGCASLPADWGRSEVAKLAAERGRSLPVPEALAATNARLLAAPLTAEAAVQLALLNNPELKRETARLGFSAAQVYDAGRLANPVFSLTRLAGDSSAAAAVPQLTLGLALDFANLLFLPANRRIAEAQFEADRQAVAAFMVELAADVERAWFAAIAAEQLRALRDTAARAQAASARLAQRYFEAGNLTPREQALEQAAASRLQLAAISAAADAIAARTRLNRLMGLPAGQGGWQLSGALAEPLAQEDEITTLQQLAVDSRLDVLAARTQAQALADRYGLTRRTRLVGGISLGVEHERDFDGGRNTGPQLALELPLFNWGGGRTAAAQAALAQAEAALDARVLDTSNEVQLAAARVQAARQLAIEYRERLIPQQEAVVAQAQAEQNYMLIAVFEVILAKVQVYDAYAGYLEAVRDYWTARTDLTRAVGRVLPSTAQAARPIELHAPVTPPASADGHAGHHGHHSPAAATDADPHAGHGVPAGAQPASADPHASHRHPAATSPVDAIDSHAGHHGHDPSAAPPAPASTDPHAGHHGPSGAPPAESPDPHAGHHGDHSHHGDHP